MTIDDPSSAQVPGQGSPVARRLSKVRFTWLAGVVWVALAVTAAFVILVQGGSELLKQPIRLNVSLFVLSFVVAYSGLLVAFLAWRRILAGYGVHQSIRNDLRVYCYSALGVTLPGGIWPTVGRLALYQRLGENGLHVAAASVVESFVIGVAAMGVYAVSAIVRPDLSLLRRPEVGVGFALLVVVLMQPRVFNRVSTWMLRWFKGAKEPLTVEFRTRGLVKWLGLEAVVVIMGGLALFVLLTSLIAVPGAVALQVIGYWGAAAAVGNLFFWLPGTFLVRDGALILALTPTLPPTIAILFAVLARVWSVAALLIIAGLAWMILDRPHRATKRRNLSSSSSRTL